MEAVVMSAHRRLNERSAAAYSRWNATAKILILHSVQLIATGWILADNGLTTKADVIYRKSAAEPLAGWIQSETDNELVLRPFSEAKETDRIRVAKADIELRIPAFDRQRLEGLVPSNPASYRDYAEELAARSLDPESRELAVRLYLIVANLDSGSLRESSLRALYTIARSANEKNRFRALAESFGISISELAPRAGRAEESAPEGMWDDPTRLKAIELMRLFRRSQIGPAKTLMGDTRLAKAWSANIKNPSWSNLELIKGDEQITAEGLQRMIQIQFELEREQTTTEAKRVSATSWNRLIEQGEIKPVVMVNLQNVCEFDPRDAVYRDGAWTRPTSP
jgi:hypothetical protein